VLFRSLDTTDPKDYVLKHTINQQGIDLEEM
jgi:hypothetical protein